MQKTFRSARARASSLSVQLRLFNWFSHLFSASQKVPWFPAGEVAAVVLVWFVHVI
ncbi:MAG: hypothetical protein Q7R47_03885 [Candidatus Diapherotrites archaeon]|nr:hypothetical protein [Candidatus Diapherotrites archaeon]